MPEKPVEQHARFSWTIVSQAYAQPPDGQDIKQFSLPEETQTQQVYRGLFGAIPKNVWFVIAGSQLTKEAAEKQVDEIRRKGFSADVYAPYGGNPYYAVVIGAQITLSEARELQRNAIESGLPGDTYLWTFPQR